MVVARLFREKESQDAEASYSTDLQPGENPRGLDAVVFSQFKLKLGRLFFDQGRYSAAVIVFQHCVQYSEANLGGEDGITLEAYSDLAMALSLNAVADDAEVYIR